MVRIRGFKRFEEVEFRHTRTPSGRPGLRFPRVEGCAQGIRHRVKAVGRAGAAPARESNPCRIGEGCAPLEAAGNLWRADAAPASREPWDRFAWFRMETHR